MGNETSSSFPEPLSFSTVRRCPMADTWKPVHRNRASCAGASSENGSASSPRDAPPRARERIDSPTEGTPRVGRLKTLSCAVSGAAARTHATNAGAQAPSRSWGRGIGTSKNGRNQHDPQPRPLPGRRVEAVELNPAQEEALGSRSDVTQTQADSE